MEKVCFKCGQLKSIEDYYKHSQMGDGHLNKCKTCTRNDAKNDHHKNKVSISWVESQRTRGRDKYRRLYAGTGKANSEANLKWSLRFPEKVKAISAASKLAVEKEEKHHWSYLPEHHKDIIHVTTKEHGKLHRFIIYDQERMMYRRYDTNELLDTREKHETFVKWCIENRED